jgi:hypothetical protein
LHKIIVRENLINEIKKLIQHQNDIDAARSEVSELVKAIRYESLDIVDDISLWKSNQSFSREFLYRGDNYLVKMHSDLDFLDDYDEFNFGFPITGNPFVFPYCGGRQLPEHMRFSDRSMNAGAGSSSSGFVTSKKRMEDDILVDGIEVSRLQISDNIIREEVANREHKNSQKRSKQQQQEQQHSQYTQQHHHHQQQQQFRDHSVLGVGENGMNDSYMSAAPRGGQGQSVSFRDHVETFHEPSMGSVSYGGPGGGPSSQLPPLQHQSYASTAGEALPEPPSHDSGYSIGSSKPQKKKGSKKPKKSRTVTIETVASPPKRSVSSAPTPKWVAKTNQIRQMKDRAAVLIEEVGVVKAMHAHVSDQVEFKVSEYEKLTEIRDGLEDRRRLAVQQDRPVRVQDFAVKVNVADSELQQIHYTVKDLQRQKFFFEQEIKRKRQTVKRLQKETEDVSRRMIIQKKLEKRAKTEVLISILYFLRLYICTSMVH